MVNATQCSLNWISAMCVDTKRSIKQISPKSVRVDCVMPLPITTYFLLSRQKAAENSFFDLCCIPTDLASPAANLTVVDWLMTPPCLPESSWYISLWRRPSRALLGGTKSNIHCVQTLTVCAGRWENNDEAKTRLQPRRISIYVWEIISVVVLLLCK